MTSLLQRGVKPGLVASRLCNLFRPDFVRTEPRTVRFALSVGLLLLGFSLADGHILPEVHGGVLGVKLDRPWVVLLFLVGTSIYASYRYWYFAIKVPISRTAIRRI